MSYRPLEYLRHILIETDYIIRHSAGIQRQAFLQDETLRRAFARSLEVIGEAAKRVPDDCRQRYPGVEWRAMTGMRDRLIHGYFGVDYEIVWDVVVNKAPTLRHEIDHILRQEEKKD